MANESRTALGLDPVEWHVAKKSAINLNINSIKFDGPGKIPCLLSIPFMRNSTQNTMLFITVVRCFSYILLLLTTYISALQSFGKMHLDSSSSRLLPLHPMKQHCSSDGIAITFDANCGQIIKSRPTFHLP